MTHDDPVDRRADGDEAANTLHEIDALLDGEPVDGQALRAALDDQEARDYLVDALLLRRCAREMGPMTFAIPGAPRGGIVRRLRWVAAALIVAVSAGAGYAYGKGSDVDDASSGYVEVMIDNRQPPPAPEPTRTIRFEPGVNWNAADRSQ